MSSRELIRSSGEVPGPLVARRVGFPATLDRFPGGAAGRGAVGAASVLLAMHLPDFILGEHTALWWRVLLAGGLGVAFSSSILLVPWWRRRRLRRVASWNGVDPLPVADMVRLVGTIEAVGRPFCLPGSAAELVYALTRFHEAARSKWGGFPAIDDVRAVPFQVRVSEQTVVQVPPVLVRVLDQPAALEGSADAHQRALALEPPSGSVGTVARLSLAPGDRVELVGRLRREVRPEGQSVPGRGVPLALVASPTWDGSVWVRRLEP